MDASTAGNVKLLSTFHYVLAGLGVLFSFLPALYVALGWAVVTGALGRGGKAPPPPAQLGWVFVALGLGLMVAGFAYVVLLALAGRFLGRHRHWTFCIVVAALSCAVVPLGTVLGVFTILVLTKPDVKAAFGEAPPQDRA